MALYRVFCELARVSGSVFILVCIASALGLLLAILLFLSYLISRVKLARSLDK